MDIREKIRKDCHADLEILRASGELPERAFRLMERLVERLDRLETGQFDPAETPTSPDAMGRHSSAAWSNAGVLKALEAGKKPEDE